ncbi:hypothetical protein P3S67_018774 [Capsicum chacoense]
MMETEDKTLFCFCYWGRKNKVLPDGSISYGGGITDQVIAKTGIKYNDFVTTVFDRLGIDPSEPDTTPVGHDENDLASCLKKARIQSAGDSNPLKKAMVHQSVRDGNPQQKEAVGGDDQKHAGHAWVREELPVSCGKFRRGSSKYTSDRLIFSHQVQCEKDESGLYIIYPRKGETWALFKDWDIRWSRKYKYEIVEVLSEFVGDAGIQVGYLAKVAGFISLFQRTSLTLAGAFFVKQEELYKFSHRIPSKMSRTEREGVPVGSFELDPASLPLNPSDIWCPRIVEEELRTRKSEPVENVLPAFPLGTTDKFRTSLKLANLNGIPVTDGESAKVQSSSRSYRQATR